MSASILQSENFDIYETVKSSPSDWRTELRNAERELDQKVSALPSELKFLNVTKVVQLDKDALDDLDKALQSKHPKSYQLYSFPHDGKKPYAALFVIVPPIVDQKNASDRAFVKSKDYNAFIDQLMQEKLIAMCRTKKSGFVSYRHLGYEFSALKHALVNAVEQSKLGKFLVETNTEISVVEGREEKGFQITSNQKRSPQDRGQVDINMNLTAVLVSSQKIQ